MAQLFVGHEIMGTNIYGMKTERQFVNMLQDVIHEWGAMDKLLSDGAQVEISEQVKDILCAYHISDWQSEPMQRHQNFIEYYYQTVKTSANCILDQFGAPAETWLLALKYVAYVLNQVAHESLGYKTPLQALTGQCPDISAILIFHFW